MWSKATGKLRPGSRIPKHVSLDIKSFYITNFHDSVLTIDIWRMYDRLGKPVDVFFSTKVSRMGKRFGFVIF